MPRDHRRHSWFVGFDCRRCRTQIPVCRSLDARSGTSALIVMCPQCGFSSSYAEREAYRFACEVGAAEQPSAGRGGGEF
jgi:RNase P subunit RPR2